MAGTESMEVHCQSAIASELLQSHYYQCLAYLRMLKWEEANERRSVVHMWPVVLVMVGG